MTVDIVAEADQAAAQAAAEVELLEQAVRRGDQDITPEQIDQARSAARHAELRREAARHQADRDELAAARAGMAALAGELEASGMPAITAARERVAVAIESTQAALTELAAAVEDHDTRLKGYHDQLSAFKTRLPGLVNLQLNTRLSGNDVHRHNRHEFEIAGIRFGTGSIQAAGWRADPVTVNRAVSAALAPVRKLLSGDMREGAHAPAVKIRPETRSGNAPADAS